MSFIKTFLTKNPALLLLLAVYLFFIPSLLSYHHAWSFPEEFFLKKIALKNGPSLQWSDIKVGLDWNSFEYAPRITRPLSAYFEILDTKFRGWLWHYMLPHPSLSLTWIFSLIGAPFLLYRLLRYWKICSNTAITMVSFYLMTPAIMSTTVMLFRPAKPMSNFFIILSLYLASQLQQKFLDQGKKIPAINYIGFLTIAALSMYWDETMCLIFPAIILLFPKVLLSRKSYLAGWLSLPLITMLFYFKIIPFLTMLAGYPLGDVLKYKESFRVIDNVPLVFLQCLFGNTKNIILQTIGIMIPDFFNASLFIRICFSMTLIAWGVLLTRLLKSTWRWDWLTLFLGVLICFFNYLMAITSSSGVWGPYYYGAFWSIFFVIWLAKWIERSALSKFFLTMCFFPILLSMFFGFIAINTVYKRHHFYVYNTSSIVKCFEGKKSFFDADEQPLFSGSELKWYIQSYWLASKQNPPVANLSALPRELYWLILELYPDKARTRYELFSENTYIPTLIFDFK